MVTPSLTRNDAGYARNPLSPEGLRRFGAIRGVGLPRRWLGHRLCQAALHLAPTRRNQTHPCIALWAKSCLPAPSPTA